MLNCPGPLEINPCTREPFLRLRKHPNVIITPPRESDIPHILLAMNDERVYPWLNNPPHPYTQDHALSWINKIKPECNLGLGQLNDGSDIFLGDIGLFRCPAILLENPKHNNTTNLALPEGHPDIVWTIGDFLVPSHHGKGIMTDAIDTLINEIGKPHLGVQHTIAMAYIENEGSRKVFMRNGFSPLSVDDGLIHMRSRTESDLRRSDMTQCIGPLEINPLTREPFLRLRGHPNIIVTPPRLTDAPFIVPAMNDERVYTWLITPPFPYYPEHAEQFINYAKPFCDHGIRELTEALGTMKPIKLTHFPVRFMREVQEDGSDVYLGDIGIDRCGEIESLLEKPKHTNEENLALPAGNPEIVWTIGCYLVPSHHGRGIMSDAVDTMINELGRPYLGVRNIVTTTFFGNEGSMKVFLKNGFELTRRLADHGKARGETYSLNVFESHFSEQGHQQK